MQKKKFYLFLTCSFNILRTFPFFLIRKTHKRKIAHSTRIKSIHFKAISSSLAQSKSGTIVDNLRPVIGSRNALYRCAKHDNLAKKIEEDANICLEEKILLEDANLIIDLRSDEERNDEKIRLWTSAASRGGYSISSFEELTKQDSLKENHRRIIQLDALSRQDFLKYMESEWFSPKEAAMASMMKIFDTNSLHNLRMKILNERGLLGLNQGILVSGGVTLCQALKAIVTYLEFYPTSPVIINCVKGKDRTGMLSMLCQSVLGVSDDDIIKDYNLSEKLLPTDGAYEKPKPGSLDRFKFSGAPKSVMKSTLLWIREEYGSVNAYLDTFGFDSSWRDRFCTALNKRDITSENYIM